MPNDYIRGLEPPRYFDTSDNPSYRVRTIKDKEIWENVVDARTGLIAGPETSWTLNELEMEERDGINALRVVKQDLSDAVAIAEKAAAGKAISGGLIKEGDQLNFVVVVLSDDHVKEVFLEPPRATSKSRSATHRMRSPKRPKQTLHRFTSPHLMATSDRGNE
ncbi:peptidase [Bradyrhizobium sp. CB1650]|uniref:PepSY domain-containing protein n=1 Tax=Bradyrhizobium sp. CB1650 TaxID=3039153 RepID=UPI002434EB80|nr:PepSY domain-containing protein [Bradyrhizobium sp. CB1650]WGD55249.1 peptidase [Bradyrhizobium sp. CB1650]